MAGILESIDNLLGTRLGLLVNDPRAAIQQMNQQAGAFNQASLLATQAERNAMRGIPITPEQAAAKKYVDKVNEDLAMGFAGTTSPLIKEGNPIQSAVVLIGDKIFTGKTHSDALQRAIYEGVVRKEAGKLVFPKGAEIDSDLFMTKDGRIIDRLQAYKMFDIGGSEQAIDRGLMQNKPAGSMGVDYYMQEAKKIKGNK
jgi:hypothetical protein